MTSREIAQEARLLVPTCRPHSSWSGPAAEKGSLGSITCFQPVGRREGLFLPPPPSLLYRHLHFQSVLSSNGTVYTVVSDTPFTSLAKLLALE